MNLTLTKESTFPTREPPLKVLPCRQNPELPKEAALLSQLGDSIDHRRILRAE
jgi:hypothetical protein